MVIMTSRYQIVTNTATQTATIVSESPILAWYQARIGDSDTIVTGLPTLDTIVAHNCQIVNRLDTIVTHNCNDAVWVGPNQSNRTKIKYKYNNNNKYNRLVRLLIGTQLLDFTIVPNFLHPLHCH